MFTATDTVSKLNKEIKSLSCFPADGRTSSLYNAITAEAMTVDNNKNIIRIG